MSNSKTCTIEGCERPHRARGMCTTHRYRFDNGLPMETEVRQYEHERICKIEGCENSRVSGGDGTHCAMHKRRVDRHGEAGDAARQRAPFGDPAWSQPNVRRRKKLREYGLTPEQFDALLLAQNYRCAICRTDKPGNARTKSDHAFCVDHCHKTGAVRGLLCQACNRGIGLLKDDPDVLLSAVEYVRRHQGDPMAMSNASFRGRVGAKSDDPNDLDAPGSKPDAEDKAEAVNPAGYETHEKAASAAHAHHAKEARKVGMS